MPLFHAPVVLRLLYLPCPIMPRYVHGGVFQVFDNQSILFVMVFQMIGLFLSLLCYIGIYIANSVNSANV